MRLKRLDSNTRTPRLPIIGKLRKGAERTEEDKENRRPGADLKWFRFTSKEPGCEEVFYNAFGNDPAIITAVLTMPTPEECFSTRREARDKSGIVTHICDGETATFWRDEQNAYHNTPIPCPGGCEEVGTLYLEIPELTRAGYSGWVALTTGSGNDIEAIDGALQVIYEKRRGTILGLRGVPVIIRRQPHQVPCPIINKQGVTTGRVRREKWLVELLESPEWAQRELERAQDEAMRQPHAPLPPDDLEDELEPGTAPKVRFCPPVERWNSQEEPEPDPEPEPAPEPQPQPKPEGAKPANGNGKTGVSDEQRAAGVALWGACFAEARGHGWGGTEKELKTALEETGPLSLLGIIAENGQATLIERCRALGRQQHEGMRLAWLNELRSVVETFKDDPQPAATPSKTRAVLLFKEIWNDVASNELVETLRHLFLGQIYKPSLREWSNPQLVALNVRLSPEGPLDPVVREYVRETVAEVQATAGQQELFPEEVING